MLAAKAFDRTLCVGRTGSRRWTPPGGTMAGRGEVVQELHVGRSWCQLHGPAGECLEMETLTEYFPAHPPTPHPTHPTTEEEGSGLLFQGP